MCACLCAVGGRGGGRDGLQENNNPTMMWGITLNHTSGSQALQLQSFNHRAQAGDLKQSSIYLNQLMAFATISNTILAGIPRGFMAFGFDLKPSGFGLRVLPNSLCVSVVGCPEFVGECRGYWLLSCKPRRRRTSKTKPPPCRHLGLGCGCLGFRVRILVHRV